MIGRGCHRADHLGRQHAGRRAAQEHVAAGHHVGERARRRLLAVALLRFVELAAARILALVLDHAARVDDEDVLHLHAEADHDVEAGDRRRAGADDTSLIVSIGLPTSSRPLSSAAPEMIAVPCWSSWKTGSSCAP
jgi:hypothetical protein